MINLRKANQNDCEKILKILKEVDLYYASLSLENFYVAEKNHQIIGTVQLTAYENYLFLACLAVTAREQKNGTGKIILDNILLKAPKDIYLYTIIPEFFKKFGFKIMAEPPFNLPSKDHYDCEDCHTDKCVTMVRKTNAA